jgi:iron complex outermembrane receptor protein
MLALQYSAPITEQTKLVIRGEWQYKGKMYFDYANTLQQGAYNLVHTRAGIDMKHLGIFVWCRNVLDKKYIAYAYDFGAVHLGDRRTFGVTVSTRL